MISRITLASISVVILAGLLWPTNARAEFSVPAGFADQAIVGGVPEPTAFDWLPGGDLLITTQRGVLFRWAGAGDAQPVLDLSGAVCAGGEMGLLGIAVDPAFQSGSPFIYLYYTHRGGSGGCDAASRANRVPASPSTAAGPSVARPSLSITSPHLAGTTTVAICSLTAMGSSMSL